jgi:glycosyltransferase involved in cell wall biosynthesis
MVDLCAVVPVYEHEVPVASIVASLRALDLPVLLVDDGSGPSCARTLDHIAAADAGVTLVRLPVNQGKGAAVMAGFAAAAAAGRTHVLQIDADGQHDVGDLQRFVADANTHPDAVICGRPVFDHSVPASRLYLRYLTHIMVWINTLSFSIRDSMCGFRVYPLQPVLQELAAHAPGRRMDFDVELLVRLHWRGIPMVWRPTRVRYPEDGVSHFRLVRDNVLISLMHARLFLGMIPRAPGLLARRLRPRLGDARAVS